MANICSNHLIISSEGEGSSLDALYARISSQDQVLLSSVPNFRIVQFSDYCISSQDSLKQDEDGDIEIYFGSRGTPPIEALISLSEEYPDLVFNLDYEEGGNDQYGEVFIQDGSSDENEMSAEDYYLKYNTGYQTLYEQITNSTYEEFISLFSNGNFFDEYPFSYLDKLVLDRIKDEELPMFINRQWMDMAVTEKYKRRLAGDKEAL